MGGFQLKGDAVEISNEDLVRTANDKLREYGFDSKLHRVWALEVKEIYSLKPSSKSRLPQIGTVGDRPSARIKMTDNITFNESCLAL